MMEKHILEMAVKKKKYNVTFPIAGALNFYNVEAESKQEAIEMCYDLCSGSANPLEEFDGEWDMYKRIAEGNVVCVPYTTVDIYEAD